MKKSSRFTGLVLAVMGTMVLLNNLGKPRVEALHGSDVWGLVASGMCLGIGFVGLMGRLQFGSFDSSWEGPKHAATERVGCARFWWPLTSGDWEFARSLLLARLSVSYSASSLRNLNKEKLCANSPSFPSRPY
jgi:hypothetical protein